MKRYSPRQWATIIMCCVTIGIASTSIAQSVLPNGIMGAGPANPAGYCASQTAPSGPNGIAWSWNCTDAGGVFGAVTGAKFVGGAGTPGPAGPQGPAGPAGPQGATGAQGPQGIQGIAGPTGATGATGPAGAMSSSFTCTTVTFNASGASFSGCK